MKIGFMQRDLAERLQRQLSERVSASFAFAAKQDDAWPKKIVERQ
jgi:hypothetical protein